MAYSKTFNAWKFVTQEKVIMKLPLYSLKPQELMLTKVNSCFQSNQIILEFSRSPLHQEQYTEGGLRHKGPGASKSNEATRNEGTGTEYSDKSDPIWR